jgi:hypothetical protein
VAPHINWRYHCGSCRRSFMIPTIKPDAGPRWRVEARRYAEAWWRSVGIGLSLGSLVSIALHLFARDSHFGTVIRDRLAGGHAFDGLRAYSAEIVVLLMGAAVITFRPARSWLTKFGRSWWAGITSLASILSASSVAITLNSAPGHIVWCVLTGCIAMAVLIVLEVWRRATVRAPVELQPDIPTNESPLSNDVRWIARPGDDPIQDFSEDILGRTAVVELLANHVLRLRTPIVALNAALGDGKTSVLNLLRKSIERHAIVIFFSAWLPNSEATLASDLFRDIAAEIRKVFSVPELRKRTQAFARMVGGSVSFLGGLKELIPAQSQAVEISELQEVLARIPRPVAVLIDEIDRMHTAELTVLLRILRGAVSIKNVTFVCAFSEVEVQKQLQREGGLSPEYLEKFFPVSISLSSPPPERLGTCFRLGLVRSLSEQGWFSSGQESAEFSKLLEYAWTEPLQRICTNLRRVGLLISDIAAAGRSIVGEVDPLDLVMIEALRRFSPSVHRTIRKNADYFSGASLLRLTEAEEKPKVFFKELSEQIDSSSESPEAMKQLLCYLFPAYATASDIRFTLLSIERGDQLSRFDDKRIHQRDYFRIYFQAAVPEDVYSAAELDRLIVDLQKHSTEIDLDKTFQHQLDLIGKGDPRRADLLDKLARHVDRLSGPAREQLAYAAAGHAHEYEYDVHTLGEATHALNLVFAIARNAPSAEQQRVIEGAIARASHDRFAHPCPRQFSL